MPYCNWLVTFTSSLKETDLVFVVYHILTGDISNYYYSKVNPCQGKTADHRRSFDPTFTFRQAFILYMMYDVFSTTNPRASE